mgnify:CR=1 FL=1
MLEIHNMPKQDRQNLGKRGRQHVLANYGMAQFAGLCYQNFKEITELNGSWATRKNYKSYTLEVI